MNITSRALRVRAFGAPVATLAVALFMGISAPIASADALPAVAPSLPNATVLVPRITKGSYGTLMRVKRDSPQAKRYFASAARAQAPKSANCSGTICPKTRTCYDVKGALGARCLTN